MTLQDYFLKDASLQNQWACDKNTSRPEEFTLRSRAKVWWRCKKGHTWQAAVDSRVYGGRSCPYCSNQTVIPSENDILTLRPEMARLWHPTRNGDLLPSKLVPGSGKQVWWQCEMGHEWRAAVYSVKAGSACPYCSGRNAIPGETDLATTHPHVLKLWNSKNKLHPHQVTANSHQKVWWICEKGHEWEAVIGSVAVEGCGCPYCAGKRAIPGETDLATVRPDILEQWDFEKNTLSPMEILPSCHDKVWWKCDLGHSWQAVVFSRTKENGSGCPYCTGKKVLAGFNDLATLKPKLAEEWYQTLNSSLRPEDVTLGSNKKVWWKCQDGHVWKAAIYSRTRQKGTGCPVCAGRVKQTEPSVSKKIRPVVRTGVPIRLK